MLWIKPKTTVRVNTRIATQKVYLSRQISPCKYHVDQLQDVVYIPLHPVPPVMPPLRQRLRLRFVKDLLHHDEALTPELKLVNLAIVRFQTAVLKDLLVEVIFFRQSLEPLSRVWIRRWYEQCQGPEGFVGESFWEQRIFTGIALVFIYLGVTCSEPPVLLYL